MSRWNRMLSFASSFAASPIRSLRHPAVSVTSRRQLAMSMPEPATVHDIPTALSAVAARVSAAAAARGTTPVQLVAVSKTKPIDALRVAYEAGHRIFGENYVQELVQKANELPPDILWHYIGPLQTNKAKLLASISNLAVVESVDRERVASALDKAMTSMDRKLNVLVQVNTSAEESKAGCQLGATVELARYVKEECKHLQLAGLMTIGAPDSSEAPEAFRLLVAERDAVADALGMERESLKLSMGMSGDYEAAIRMGSDSVRVGSTIFGAREDRTKH